MLNTPLLTIRSSKLHLPIEVVGAPDTSKFQEDFPYPKSKNPHWDPYILWGLILSSRTCLYRLQILGPAAGGVTGHRDLWRRHSEPFRDSGERNEERGEREVSWVWGLTEDCRCRHQAMESSGVMERDRTQTLSNANPLPSCDSLVMASAGAGQV